MESRTCAFWIMNTFIQMEERHSLFDYKTKNGIPVWDMFRYHLISLYLREKKDIPISKKKRKTPKFYINAFKILFSSFFSLIFRRKENIVFSYARNLDNRGMLFDMVSENIIKELGSEVLIIDNMKASQKYKHRTEINFVNYFFTFIFIKDRLSKNFFTDIQIAFEKEFGEVKFTYEELNDIYVRFLKEYSYYRRYFKYKKPKRIFLLQNGIQKGLIYAAQSLNIPIFELQHGIFNYTHFAYSYPAHIEERDARVILPDMVLTFSNYWGNNMNLPIPVIPIGNDYFAERMECQTDNSLLFISTDVYRDYLSELAIEYARLHSNIIINFKLHANEYSDEDYYKKKFAPYKNIHIIKNELSAKTLSSRASLVVLIVSTVLFEALHTNAKVGIYKKLDYESLNDYFNLPNVYLIDTVEELHDAYLAEKKESVVPFFDKFDKTKFKELIK